MAAFGQMTAIDAYGVNLSNFLVEAVVEILCSMQEWVRYGWCNGEYVWNMMGGVMQQPQQQPPPMTASVFHYNGPSDKDNFALRYSSKNSSKSNGCSQYLVSRVAFVETLNQVPEIANLVPPSQHRHLFLVLLHLR